MSPIKEFNVSSVKSSCVTTGFYKYINRPTVCMFIVNLSFMAHESGKVTCTLNNSRQWKLTGGHLEIKWATIIDILSNVVSFENIAYIW